MNGVRLTRSTAMRVALILAGLSGTLSAPASALDTEHQFARGTTIVGLGVNGGVQANIQRETEISGITFVGLEPRLSYLPFEPFGASWYRAAIEPGVAGWFEYYLHPQRAGAAGVKLALRLHAIGLGPLIPYIEGLAGAGGTGLDLLESRSTFTFILEAGAGASVFVAPGVAVNLGYRLHHLSNGHTSRPNRGFNAHTGILGVSVFFR